MTQKVKSVLNRFAKAFVFGALSSTTMIAVFSGNSFQELSVWISATGFVLLTGGINGILMALQKWIDWEETYTG
jgi:hypothetical protein